ncbi:hypothetical protein L5M18_01195 [Shewanella sp. SM20]|uniref:leucine-rich repeat domain-containing protein n=1 Tax=Shewanella sp. SM20 TaxID=2912792 RepID=UPI0021D9A4E4|nr:hypothetical protein [Shewanella sp. SM20]MCU8090194.1 hypothetical protein [Shewanella sp. SM20]
MNSIFGGESCRKVALHFENHVHDLLVFSICSDERFPDGLEAHIINKKGPENLLIVGDFMTSYPSKNESSASYEAIKLILAHSNLRQVNVGWIRGVDIQANLHKNIEWHTFYSANNTPDEKKDTSLQNDVSVVSSSERQLYRHICKLLNFPVYVGVESGKIVSIDLTDNQPYPRGLTNNLSNKQMLKLWKLVSSLRNLKKINARFNGLSFLPDFSSFTQLEKLDLRGNPPLDFNELHTASTLSYLNISACSLTKLPSSINSLHNLKTLLAYKNYITDISTIRFPKSIERISLYRNNIRNEILDLGYCDNLREINLGANPILNMALITSPSLRTLQLRARYTKDNIKVSSSESTTFLIFED